MGTPGASCNSLGLTGGLKRLTSVSGTTKAKKEEEKKIEMSCLPYNEVEAATINHITIVSEAVEQHSTQRHQTENHLRTFSEEVMPNSDWLTIHNTDLLLTD